MDKSIEKIVDMLCMDAKKALKDNFVGFYVHGSVAMSGFNPRKSDLDYIIVCKKEPDMTIKKSILESAEEHWDLAPAKGLEMHVLCLEDCRKPADKPKFVLHYSAMHRNSFKENPENYIGYMHGKDGDLNAHFTVLRARGICYEGMPIPEVFGEVTKEKYLEALIDDAEWNEEDTMYHVLNSARSIAFVQEGTILSKLEGGIWALQKFPEYKELLEEAIQCCKGDKEMKATSAAEQFCTCAYKELQEAVLK